MEKWILHLAPKLGGDRFLRSFIDTLRRNYYGRVSLRVYLCPTLCHHNTPTLSSSYDTSFNHTQA